VLRPLRAFSRGFLLRAVDRATLEETFLRGSAEAYRGIGDEFVKRIHTGQMQGQWVLLALGAIAVVGYLLAGS